MWRWMVRVVGALAALVGAFALGGAVSAMSRLPDLQPWHHLVTSLEPRADDIGEGFTLDDYLRREDAVFAEARQQIEAVVAAGADPLVPNRYVAASRSAPSRFATDFNRTQIVAPTEVRGGALLLHGLTDAPYSMRAMAERLQADGFITLSLRMQGHGTVPGGLVGVTWEDWAAAVRMAARHVRGAIGEGQPLVIVGYSNGGALAVNYTLEALEDARLADPDGAGAAVADDWRVAGRAGRPPHQPARPVPVLREGPLARRRARVQPVQVQLVSGQCRAADGAVHGRDSEPLEPRGRGRPADPVPAGAGLPVGGRHHA